MSALAKGADRLVGDVALSLGLDLAVPMPMSRKLYETDFASEESRLEFIQMCERASSSYELPPVPGSTLDDLGASGKTRDLQYAQLGVFLCAHCHVLLALWDGKPADEVGGTAQVVRFHHDDGMPAEGFRPFECTWFPTDPDVPWTSDLPEKYRRIFERTSEFNRDVLRHSEQIDADGDSLSIGADEGILPRCVNRIEYLYRAADWLAIHYQKRLTRALKATHGLAFFMGILFLLYSDFEAQDMRNGMFFTPGLLLLMLGIRQSFAHQIAEKELIKQYEFMLSIFGNARGRPANASGNDERRRILRVLGESALDEHAEWIFVRRDRPLDSGAVWRMET
mgnify:CR=1 FL=1